MEQELRFWQGVAKVVEHATEIGLGDKKHEKGKEAWVGIAKERVNGSEDPLRLE